MRRRQGFRGWLGRQVQSLAGWIGAYQSTDTTRRLLDGWKPQRASSNQSLVPTLSTLVAQCRQIERTVPVARAVIEGLRADVIGSGIDVLPLGMRDVETAQLVSRWHAWCDRAGVNGETLWELQALGMSEIATAGAALWRWVPSSINPYGLALLPLEVEWLAEYPVDTVPAGMTFVRGILVDRLGVPQFYDLRNPESMAGGERVPAAQIVHCFERRRALQTHGEPILAPVIERLYQDNELVAVELQSARKAAAMAVAITSEQQLDEEDDDGNKVTDIPGAAAVNLAPGEGVEVISSDRPSQAVALFRGTIRGDIAAACRVSRWLLDRDPSQASYSSGRLDQLIGKRVLAPLKSEIGRHLAGRIFERIAPLALLESRMPMPKGGLRYDLRPDQPEYVDPTKDAEAALTQLDGNLTTLEKVCSDRGLDWQQVLEQRARERDKLAELGLQSAPRNSAAGISGQG
jgi:lambda family phage portal protein